jgi:D-alanyl-D-alanine carboxypeptidase
MVRGKTGSIGGVRSVSGYATTRSGDTLVFSIIYNEAHHSEEECEKLADDALRQIVNWPNLAATGPAK